MRLLLPALAFALCLATPAHAADNAHDGKRLGSLFLQDRGGESWQMVRAQDGRKISSMLYSIDR